MDRVLLDILGHLYSVYLANPIDIVTITKICDSNGVDPIEFSKELELKGWIRDRIEVPGGEVKCRITLDGIYEFEPIYVMKRIMDIMDAFIGTGGGNIMEIVDFIDYTRAYDFAENIKSRGWGNIFINDPERNIVQIELTPSGREWRDRNSAFFN